MKQALRLTAFAQSPSTLFLTLKRCLCSQKVYPEQTLSRAKSASKGGPTGTRTPNLLDAIEALLPIELWAQKYGQEFSLTRDNSCPLVIKERKYSVLDLPSNFLMIAVERNGLVVNYPYL